MADSTSPESVYLKTLFFWLVLGLCALGLNAMEADPFGTWRNMGLRPADTAKDPIVWSRTATGERIVSGCDLVILGSSRLVFGLGPKLPKWGEITPCNGAMGGTSLRELEHGWDLALTQDRVRHLVLFLDLHLFDDNRAYYHDFRQSRLNEDRSVLSYYTWNLFSSDVIMASAVTRRRMLPWIDAPKDKLATPIKANMTQVRSFLSPKAGMYRRFSGYTGNMTRLEGMLDRAEAKGVRVTLVIPAIHAMQMEMMVTTGHGQTFLDWKRDLVELLATRDAPPPLWDFATYHHYALSDLPNRNTDAASPWWIDTSHQSMRLGILTLNRLADAETGQTRRDWGTDFGVLLTTDNIDAHLAKFKPGRKQWITEHPDDVAWYHAQSKPFLRAPGTNAPQKGKFSAN